MDLLLLLLNRLFKVYFYIGWYLMVGLDSQAEQHFSTVFGIRINMLHFLMSSLILNIRTS